jgi:large subunit ribosomal protein L7/L12
VVEALGNLTVVQLIALTRHCEQQWGVEAKPQMVQTTAVEVPAQTQVAQTEFEVVFVSFPPDKKMGLVRLVREVMGLGLLESKNLVEAVPKTLKEGVSKEEAEELKRKLTEAGGVVGVR